MTNFNGYNLASSFANVDLENNADNPYLYCLTLLGAKKAGLGSDFTKKVCDSLVNTYYTTGSGMNYYGYSCDNTAQFIIALAPYYDSYKTVINDALAVIEKYDVTGGYCYSTDYTTANTDSTALALAAYAAVGNTTKALEIYSELIAFESSTAGVFTYDGEENAYATSDELFALETLLNALPACYEGTATHLL
ncbi:MAG: hypothetical protein LUG95_02025 [Clostridiales bacterium]|nr:hypothetical protein [Clostridiales bacterium]